MANKSPCQLVSRQLKKNFFSFFTLTPSQMWLKRPVYRGFRGEGRCFLPSHYPHTLISLQKRPAYRGGKGKLKILFFTPFFLCLFMENP